MGFFNNGEPSIITGKTVIEVTGNRAGDFEVALADTTTVRVEFDPNAKEKIIFREGNVYHDGHRGFCIEGGHGIRADNFALIAIETINNQKNWRSIGIYINGVKSVVRDGVELPQEEWAKINHYE